MDINDLITIVKKKLKNGIIIENIKIEDKSFLHVGHKGNNKKKFHLKILINSKELSKISRIQSNKKIYKILEKEIKEYIHSIQILIT
tara:strand:- start:1135 stop:1395 length:261 start_codon:yes stop_codon:yes gene_type:complete